MGFEIDVFNGFADTAFDDYLWLCLFPKAPKNQLLFGIPNQKIHAKQRNMGFRPPYFGRL